MDLKYSYYIVRFYISFLKFQTSFRFLKQSNSEIGRELRKKAMVNKVSPSSIYT